MEIEITKQIIESATIFITPIVTLSLAYVFGKNLLKYKNNISREINLLNDIIFYRTLIDLYKTKVDEHEGKNYYRTFRQEAKALTDIEPSKLSEPKQIQNRLRYLNELNEKAEKMILKFDKEI